MLHAVDFIFAIQERDVANLFRTAFGSVIVSVSNCTYEPGLGSRPGAGKLLVEDADVGSVLLNKLREMRADIAWLTEETEASAQVGAGRVIHGNFFSANDLLETGSVDLMVTSPPYMNNYHYLPKTRPQLYWQSFIGGIAVHQGLRPEGIPRIRDKRAGARITRSSVRRGLRNGATLDESAVIVRRP